jgi:hypothetical protein
MNVHHGSLRLLIATLATAAIWLILLPAVSRWRPLNELIETHQRQGIDPSAMYYTELDHLTFRDGMLRRDPEAK